MTAMVEFIPNYFQVKVFFYEKPKTCYLFRDYYYPTLPPESALVKQFQSAVLKYYENLETSTPEGT